MSYSTIWKVYKTTCTTYTELRNGHGSAPPVWDWLSVNYLNKESWIMSRDEKALWALYKNQSVPRHMRFALLATFDDGLVEVNDLEEASRLARLVYETTHIPQYVNHWLDISEAYKKLSVSKDTRLHGVAIGCTSVSDPWEERKERTPFSIMQWVREYDS